MVAAWPLRVLEADAVQVMDLFPGSLAVDNFIARLEIALFAHGFSGGNSAGASGMHASPA